ncbi:Rieske 2Fe-2S domain-containing protein [Pseudonocardia sp. H11422]|uniref:Rieske 2Fe-2S domain-containing protein n=1 Tax=Pseudonocardia sp. H11422 TaxID=2835866 RepID=UPI001BDCCD9C|nr:Rieske 2Fe-2S domain-containing protein [Pseudonocardia sp. H11422]
MSTIPRDQRYVAAYGREIGGENGPELFSRTICGESILFWRTRAGQVTAMSDRCVHRRFPLSQYKLHSRIAPVGVLPNADGTDPDAFHVEVVYAITPETETSTRDFALDDSSVSDFLAEQNRTVVLQNVAALDVLETVIASEPPGYQELSINIDTGGLAARRTLAKLASRSSASAVASA